MPEEFKRLGVDSHDCTINRNQFSIDTNGRAFGKYFWVMKCNEREKEKVYF